MRQTTLIAVLSLLLLTLTACSGGGGDGAPLPQPIIYSGNSSAAVITRENAKQLIANVIGTTDATAILSAKAISGTPSSNGPTSREPAHEILRHLLQKSASQLYSGVMPLAAVAINETHPCDNPGGTVTYSGNIESDGTGILTIQYYNCLDTGTTYNGSATAIITAFDFGYLIPVEASYTFTLITAQSDSYHISMSGTMLDSIDLAGNREQITMNITSLDHNTSRMSKSENLVYLLQYDSISYPSSYSVTLTGRVYDSVEGYVDVTTDSPLLFSTVYALFPDGGGPLVLTGANSAKIRLTPASSAEARVELDLDGDGIYESLTVMPWTVVTQDGATNIPPVADAGSDMVVQQGSSVTMSGSATDEDGDFVSYQWELTALPSGSSATLSNASTPYAAFTADTQGSYLLTVTVSDGASSDSDTITVTVTPPIITLGYRIIDAEYSPALNKAVMVSASPDQLHIFDPATESEVVVALPHAPTSVSVSPDGLHAAVGYNAYMSYIDLSAASVTATYAVSTNVLDIVLASNGYAYAFPVADQWENIRCIKIATGVETLNSGGQIYAGTLARLQPGALAIYGADNGLIPSDIEKYSISGGTAVYSYDSPYHGDYDMCGDLWFSESGDRIYTRCGHLFSATSNQSTDMLYLGTLNGVNYIEYLSHSASAAQLLVIPKIPWDSVTLDEDTQLLVYDPTTLTQTASASLPPFNDGANRYLSHGRFAFFIDGGTRYLTIVEEDAAAPSVVSGILLYDKL